MAGQNQLSSWNVVSRHEALRLGGLTALGLSLPQVLRAQQAAKPKREVNCILLWMLGGPSHIDMFDLKPDAPSEIRGELKTPDDRPMFALPKGEVVRELI